MLLYFPNGHTNSDCGTTWPSFLLCLMNLGSQTTVLRRIPKGQRYYAAPSLKSVLASAVDVNSVDAWHKLFSFSYQALQGPRNFNDPDLWQKY